MRFAKVIVNIPVEEYFDYIIPEDLSEKIKVGCRVIIPFRNRRLIGYVIGLTDKTKVKNLKPILKLIDTLPLLDTKFLSLAKEASDYYCCSWAEMIETALPVSLRKGRPIEVVSSQKSVVRNKKSKFEVTLLHDLDGNKRYDFYLGEIEKTLNLDKSVIFLCPEVWQVLKIRDLLQKKFKNKIIAIHRKCSPKEEFENWNQIRRERGIICVGTRSAVFSPVCKLGLIILDLEEDSSFKQNQSPFYHAREIALMRAKRERVKVILGAISPSLESYFLIKKEKYNLIKLERKESLPEVNLIDMHRELLNRKRKVFLSKFLENRINQTVEERGGVLIFLNRRGFATHNYCQKCGFILKCPKCDVNLTYIFEKKKLICNYCQYILRVPELCPNCDSSYIRLRGFGLEKLESQLNLLFPRVKILRLEKNCRSNLSDSQILISTREIFKESPTLSDSKYPIALTKKFDLLGIISADQFLNLVDFRASEKTFSLFYRLLLLCKRTAIFQSYLPQHHSLSYLSQGDYDRFYQEELKQRRQLNFPPFSHLIKINLRGKKESSLIRVSDSLFGKIKSKIKDIEIFSPILDFPAKLRGKFRYKILLKTKDVKRSSLSLKKILKDFSHPKVIITVDVDPF